MKYENISKKKKKVRKDRSILENEEHTFSVKAKLKQCWRSIPRKQSSPLRLSWRSMARTHCRSPATTTATPVFFPGYHVPYPNPRSIANPNAPLQIPHSSPISCCGARVRPPGSPAPHFSSSLSRLSSRWIMNSSSMSSSCSRPPCSVLSPCQFKSELPSSIAKPVFFGSQFSRFPSLIMNYDNALKSIFLLAFRIYLVYTVWLLRKS